jgi:hypothetical protein
LSDVLYLLQRKEGQNEESLGRFYTCNPDCFASAACRQVRLVDFPAAHPGCQLDSMYNLDGEILQGLK